MFSPPITIATQFISFNMYFSVCKLPTTIWHCKFHCITRRAVEKYKVEVVLFFKGKYVDNSILSQHTLKVIRVRTAFNGRASALWEQSLRLHPQYLQFKGEGSNQAT